MRNLTHVDSEYVKSYDIKFKEVCRKLEETLQKNLKIEWSIFGLNENARARLEEKSLRNMQT